MNDLLTELGAILKGGGIAEAESEAASIAQAALVFPLFELANKARTMAQLRAKGMPLAYVTGRQKFMGIELLADRGALAPRAETELLGVAAINSLRELSPVAPRLVDMCCGSGNLACAIACYLPNAKVWASDLTDGCIALAQRNVRYAAVAERVTVAQGDLFGALAGMGLEGTIDGIVCNPPYISQGRLDTERAGLLQHEPRAAFDGGPYGISIQQRVVKEALPFLRPGGVLLFEIGLGQERQVKMLFERAAMYEDIREIANAAGEVRVLSGRKRM